MQKTLFFIIGILFLFLFVANADNENKDDKKTISGYIKDAETGEELIGATIYIKELKSGTTTNVYGYYALTLEPGKYNFVFSFIGYEKKELTIVLDKNITTNIELKKSMQTTEEVVVKAKRKNENIVSNEMSVVKLQSDVIKKIPALMGEVDVIKAIQLMPGVQSPGEGSSGFTVRGGSSDQNLVLLDEAAVYNASHLMGFFSVFNNDAIKSVKLYKGDIPAEYGGRLSSLLDIRMKDGNMKRLSGTGGIGTISSRFTLEGPIKKDTASFVISGRRSYADIFLPFAKEQDARDSKLYFYDLNAKGNYIINDKNRLFLSAYMGRDVFQFGSEDPFNINWGNQTFTARWNHLFSQKLFSNFTFLRSNFDYGLGQDSPSFGFEWNSKLEDYSLRADFGYYLNPNNTIRFGVQTIFHMFTPGIARGVGEETIFNEVRVPGSNALETAFFVSNEQQVTPLLALDYGIRYSIFNNIGTATVYTLNDSYEVTDTIDYNKGDFFNIYDGIEPRIGMKYVLNPVSSIKANYSHTIQYLHLASNTTIGSPLDVWIPSSPNIAPQKADQFAIGYFRNFMDDMLETSVEIYYKTMKNQVDFKDHAQLMLNPRLEAEIRTGEALAYGVELFVRKQEGKLTGWISYTYSKADRKIPEINNGDFYPASYNKLHDVSIVANYSLNERIDFSANWVYSSGLPVTLPTGRFNYNNMVAPVYSDRNSYNMPAYHRLDLAMTLQNKKNKDRRFKSEWVFSIYNAYYRKNPYMITLQSEDYDSNVKYAEMVYLFPIIPAITYNFKF